MTLTLAEVIAKCPADVLATTNPDSIAAAVSVGRVRVVSHMLSERGVMATLGTVAGEACLQALDAFAASTLPAEHPLKANHAGIKRMLGWLKTEAGLDVGTPEARTLLVGFGQLGVLDVAWVTPLLALSAVPDPVSEFDVRCVLWDSAGKWLGG